MKKIKISPEIMLDILEAVETTEEYEGYYYSVQEILVIVILGSLCGLKNVRQIHQWAKNEKVSEFLKEKFAIERIPCYYWMLSLLSLVKPDSLNACLMKWMEQVLPAKRDNITVSLDGKAIRSTQKMSRNEKALHIVSAQIAEMGVTLASKSVDSKSNEIPAVQSLIQELNIEGCLVTADALNCQRETAELIVDGGADYLLDAKKNQSALMNEIKDYFECPALWKDVDSKTVTEKNRERIETRIAHTTTDIDGMYEKEKWKNLRCIGAIRKIVEVKGAKTEEWHYYISSRVLTAEELLHHARMEWTVETMHWLLDVHYDEDFCRIQALFVQENMNMLRKLSMNILKQYKSSHALKYPLSHIMLDCLLDCRKIYAIFEN